MKIEKLTKEQESKLEAYKNKWLDIGLSTDRIDHKLATPIINDFYEKVLEKKKPKAIIILKSPIEAWFGVCLISQVENLVSTQVQDKVQKQIRNQIRNQVRDQVRDKVRDQAWGQVCGQIKNQIRDQVRNQVWGQVRIQVRDQAWGQVWDQVRNQVCGQVCGQVEGQVESQVRDQVRIQVRDQVRGQIRDQVWGQVENFIWPFLDGSFLSNIFAFYDYFNKEVGIKFDVQEKYDAWQDTSKLGLIYPLDDFCIVSQKPTEINFDKDNRLHNESGAAIKYADGFSVYSINGVRVPEKYVMTDIDKIDASEVMKEKNAEIRTAVIKRCGFNHFRKHLKSKTISSKNNNELLEFDLDDGMIVRGLLVRWKDKHDEKETVIPVPKTRDQFESSGLIPDNIDDCEHVRLWTLGLPSDAVLQIET